MSLTAGLGSVMVWDCVCIYMMAYNGNLQELNSVISERSKISGVGGRDLRNAGMLREDTELLYIRVKRRLIVHCGNKKSSEGNMSQPHREKDSTNRTQLVKYIRAANHQQFSFSI